MKINDLNEKFEDFEKENISNVFQGLMKITGNLYAIFSYYNNCISYYFYKNNKRIF